MYILLSGVARTAFYALAAANDAIHSVIALRLHHTAVRVFAVMALHYLRTPRRVLVAKILRLGL
jgi:hypothetical protein